MFTGLFRNVDRSLSRVGDKGEDGEKAVAPSSDGSAGEIATVSEINTSTSAAYYGGHSGGSLSARMSRASATNKGADINSNNLPESSSYDQGNSSAAAAAPEKKEGEKGREREESDDPALSVPALTLTLAHSPPASRRGSKKRRDSAGGSSSDDDFA
jgi:hypothetical protein